MEELGPDSTGGDDAHLYRALFRHSPDVIVLLSPTGELRIASEAAERILGWRNEDFVGRSVFTLVHPDDLESSLVSFAGTLGATGVRERIELRLRRTDGGYAPVEVVATNLADDPEVRGIVLTVRDLSDRYRADDALLTSTVRMRTLLASLPAGVLVVGIDGRIALANRQLCDLFRLDRDPLGLVGTQVALLIDDIAPQLTDPAEFAHRITELIAAGGPVTGEEVQLLDGRVLELDHLAIEVDGVERERLWVIRDVSARKASEELITMTRDRALQALDVKSQFLAMISHEVRTPMSGIIGMLDLLRDRGGGLDRETIDILGALRSAADGLMDVLDDSLDVAKIEAGQLTLNEVDFDLLEVVESAAETMGPRAREVQVAVSTWVDPALPQLVTGDPGRLRQVLLNLLGNALKFTRGGEVVVWVEPEQTTGTDSAGTVRFTVSDTGAGMDPAQLERVFEPYLQGTDATKGTGLGLSISRRLVEMMGGTIGVTSTPGQGSSFSFTIVVPPASPPAERTVARPSHAVVIGSLDGTRAVLTQILQSWGVQVSHSADLAGEVPDLVLSVGGDPDEVSRTAGPSSRVIQLGCRREVEVCPGALQLTLPVRVARLWDTLGLASARPSRPEADDPGGRVLRGRVLLAEDNPVNRRIASIALERLGVEVVAVEDGEAAVAAYRSEPFDVILMDCQMPRVDGFEATRSIRALEVDRGTRTPIIALTASTGPADRLACEAAGMDDHLSKPPARGSLEGVLARWLRPEPAGADETGRAQPGGPGAADALDLGILGSLSEELGDDAIMAEVLAAYLRELPLRRAAIVAAAGAADLDEVRSIAHTLKSSSAALGAMRLSRLCAELESRSRAAGADGPSLGLHEFEEACEAAEEWIRTWYRDLLSRDASPEP